MEILKWAANLVCTGLNFEAKVWWMIVTVLILFLIIWLIDKFKKEEPYKPDFYNYREGKPKYWKWTWDWKLNKNNEWWEISNLNAHCPKLASDTRMIQYLDCFKCPRCEFIAVRKTREYEDPNDIEHIIYDNIRRSKNEKKS